MRFSSNSTLSDYCKIVHGYNDIYGSNLTNASWLICGNIWPNPSLVLQRSIWLNRRMFRWCICLNEKVPMATCNITSIWLNLRTFRVVYLAQQEQQEDVQNGPFGSTGGSNGTFGSGEP